MELSLCLPALNEEDNIGAVVGQIVSWMRDRGIDGEIVVCDDGSSDRTGTILADLQKKHPHLIVVAHDSPQGYGAAVRSALDAASKDVIGFMDSDWQFHVADFDRLLPHLTTHAVVTGRRRKRADPFVRNVYGKVLGLLIWMTLGLWIRDVNCAMKVLRRDVYKNARPTLALDKLFNAELFLRLKKNGVTWKQVDVPHYPRQFGSQTGADLKVILRMFRELRKLIQLAWSHGNVR